ncbi:ABC transporter permease [Salinibacterium sp. ZJ450]|uniref:ABC transporter permease n=1 Tax=Salinibacterium sp. ZJ450 TaxID=2708338 RepID=UPI001CD5CB05|nr:ABC transporter permease [Salinibacterium sp. ZJ450]
MSAIREHSNAQLRRGPATAAEDREPLRRRTRSVVWLIVAPLGFITFAFLYPLAETIHLSFVDFVEPGSPWFANYEWFLANSTQLAILGRTLLVSAWVTVLCLVLGFPFAYLMTLVSPRARMLMLAAVLLPFWSNVVVRTYAWVILLQDTGPVKAALSAFGVEGPRLLGNMTGVTIGATQVLLPFLVLPLYATISGIDRRLLLAAESLGAKPRVAFVRVYLPLAMPGILAGCLTVFILMLGFYFTPALLGSPGNSLISQQIVTQVNQLLAFGRGGAMALILLTATLLLLGLVQVAIHRYRRVLGVERDAL